MNSLKDFAELFWSIGMSNLFISSNRIDEVNYIESNLLKSPAFFGTNNRLQIFNKDNIDWEKYPSFGVFLGFDSIRAIDLDGVISEHLLNEIIESLGLPINYPWIVRSGSQCGYHIFVRCVTPNDIDEKDKIRRTWVNTDIENVEKFGYIDTNAYYPDQYKIQKFHKIEFKWTGNIILPPSLHSSGNRYSFLNGLPHQMPNFVEFECLERLKDKFTSFQALSSTSHDYDYVEGNSGGSYLDIVKTHTYTGHRFADSDVIPYNYQHRPMESGAVFYISQYSVYGAQRTPLFMNQICWFVLDSRHNIIKRRIFNYYGDVLWGDVFCGSIHVNESNSIIDNSRYVFLEFLFDISHSKKIYCWNESNFAKVMDEIIAAGLYPDAFKNTEISSNGDVIDMSEIRPGQYMKDVEYIEPLIVQNKAKFKNCEYLIEEMRIKKGTNAMAFLYSIYTNLLLVKGLRYWFLH